MSAPANDTESRDELVSAYRSLIADVYELAGRSRRSSDDLAREVGQTAPRWHLMSVLTDGPLSVSESARRLGLSRQSVQRVANELVSSGLATSTPDPSDARAPRIALTELGRRTTKNLFDRSDDLRAHQLERSGLAARDLVTIGSLVRTLGDAIDIGPPPHQERPRQNSRTKRPARKQK